MLIIFLHATCHKLFSSIFFRYCWFQWRISNNIRQFMTQTSVQKLKNYYGRFTLPDTDTDTDADKNGFNSNLCVSQCLCSVNSSADYYWIHCCLCLNPCLSVWTQHQERGRKEDTKTLITNHHECVDIIDSSLRAECIISYYNSSSFVTFSSYYQFS